MPYVRIDVLIFREASTADLPQLYTLEQMVVEAERPFNSATKKHDVHYYDLPDLIVSKESLVLIAEESDRIVATGYSQIRESKPWLEHDKHGYLGFMCVLPEYRGQGINQKIMSLLMEWSQQKGVKDFYLDVYKDNQSAIKAYEKVGFKSSLVEMKLSI